MTGGILVWSERPSLVGELLGEARRLARDGRDVGLLTCTEIGDADLEAYAAAGADVVYATDKADPTFVEPGRWVGVLARLIGESRPALVLVGATKTGLEVAPRVAERCDASYAAWALGIGMDPGGGPVTAECMMYAGSAVARHRFLRATTILTVAPGVFGPCQSSGRSVRIESVPLLDADVELEVIAQRPKDTSASRLQEARAVIDIGRGVKDLGQLETIRPLAELLDAQLGCSRPVSSDRNWMPEWLGLSGAKVKPELCLTLGVSGAVQHVVGIRDSRVIVAVNSDENAAIFTQADIGVLADLAEFVPVLIERLKTKRARPAWSQAGEGRPRSEKEKEK